MGATAPWFFEQFRAFNGSMLSGGKLYFFVAGSTVIPKKVYADYGLTTELTQPLVLDGSGTAPEYFMEPGLYKIVLRDSSTVPAGVMTGNLIATRDNVGGVGGGGGGGEDSYMVKVRADDAAPGFLDTKIGASATISWEIVDVGGGVLQIRPSVNLSAVRDWKVKSDNADPEPGFLDVKLVSGDGVTVTLNPATHQIRFDYSGPIFEDDHKVLVDADDDIPGFLGAKWAPGTGIEFNVTNDGVNGKVIHISSTTEGEGAPLHEVMTGDGAGGILSSPDFTAVGGAVQGQTFQANAAGEAVTAPNGSMVAQDIAEVTLGAWGGDSAFFGKKGHNPTSNDGTISGLLAGEYLVGMYAPAGGNASLGTGSTRLAVYDEQAAIGVPFSAPALHQTDAVVLVGSSYSSTYHATICFFGTGTAFVVPAGSSLNKTIRLSNSSAASISVTGTATAFTLPPGTSRDLVWTEDSITPTVSKWY